MQTATQVPDPHRPDATPKIRDKVRAFGPHPIPTLRKGTKSAQNNPRTLYTHYANNVNML